MLRTDSRALPASTGHLRLDGVLDYLLATGLVDVEQLIEGEARVEPVRRRNDNFRVQLADGTGYFLKQPDPGTGSGVLTLMAEGGFYARSAGRLAHRLSLPRLLRWESDRPLLVLELLPAHTTLVEYARARSGHEFPIAAWREAGRRLGGVHAALGGFELLGPRPNAGPWVVASPHPHLSTLSTLSGAGATVLEILQGSDTIRAGLQEVASAWQATQTIHGDIRGSNVLVTSPCDGRPPGLRFVDWELIQKGDPLWDVAGLLVVPLLDRAGPVEGLVPSASADGADGIDTFPRTVPWPVFQAATRAAWEGYCEVVPCGHGESATKVALYAAAHLVQGVIEATVRAPALWDDLVSLLQVAENVFADPSLAATDLFALGD